MENFCKHLKKREHAFVGPFTYWHNNPPPAFNPDFDPRAVDWGTLATYDTIVAGVYEKCSREEVKAFRDAAYNRRKAHGAINPSELETAKRVIYERG